MFASRTIIAIPAAVIALLGRGSGTGGNAPSDTAVIGSPAPTNSINSTNWTLGGVPCALIPVPAAAPLGTGTCPGVRPGAIVRSDVGQCTLNFLFLGSDGASYIGTAGHCILGTSPLGGDVGEMAWAPGTGPVARDASGNPIGEFAYAILQDPKDFSLIRLDPQVQASAGMCHFGGPTAVNDDHPGLTAPVVLNSFGNGVAGGAVLPRTNPVASVGQARAVHGGPCARPSRRSGVCKPPATCCYAAIDSHLGRGQALTFADRGQPSVVLDLDPQRPSEQRRADIGVHRDGYLHDFLRIEEFLARAEAHVADVAPAPLAT